MWRKFFKHELESDDGDDGSSFDDTSIRIDTIPNVATFLVGRSSRYGRSVTFNSKYIS